MDDNTSRGCKLPSTQDATEYDFSDAVSGRGLNSQLNNGQGLFVHHNIADHPLYDVLMAALRQAMFGKGERHGGAATPFLEQPWAHYEKIHGRGFLTGQAAKKLEEAASKRNGQPFVDECLGAIVYLGMAILTEKKRAEESVKPV